MLANGVRLSTVSPIHALLNVFIKKAQSLRSTLLHSMGHDYLCHGDLHLENIIQHGETWLAIDPKGVIGEIAFEAAACDLIHPNEQKDQTHLSSIIIERMIFLANALDVKYDRLLSWVFLRLIIQSQWSIEDHDDPSHRLLLATPIYPLLDSSSS